MSSGTPSQQSVLYSLLLLGIGNIFVHFFLIVKITLTIVFKRRIMFLNISSSLGGICEIKRRIWPVFGSGTLNVSLNWNSSFTIPVQGNKCKILENEWINHFKYIFYLLKLRIQISIKFRTNHTLLCRR